MSNLMLGYAVIFPPLFLGAVIALIAEAFDRTPEESDEELYQGEWEE